jgi:hypothetical protein
MKTQSADAVKILSRRDSATTILRKMGIHSRDYNAFIEVMTDGKFACHIARAEMHLESLKQAAAKPAKSAKPAAAKKEKVVKAAARTVSAVARELIVAGKTNLEVWAVIQKEFDLDDSKKSYPAWYRSDCKRKGLVK